MRDKAQINESMITNWQKENEKQVQSIYSDSYESPLQMRSDIPSDTDSAAT